MKKLSILLFVLSLGMLVHARADEAKFIPEKGTEIRVYYYPEHWSEDQWERDIKKIAELGFTFVHYREGLWSAFNYTDKYYTMPVPDGARILTGGAELPPAGVLVWKE